MKRLKTQFKHVIDPAISFAITFFISFMAFAVNGIYPGSDKTILIFDMGSQYVSLFSYLRYIGTGYNSLMYQTLSAFGGGFYGTWAYYLSSPLSWIVLLFDPSKITDALLCILFIKLSLSSLTFSLFLKYGHIKCDNRYIVLLASVAYSLMSYSIAYSISIMWLDGVIMLPLIMWGCDRIFEGKKSYLFEIFLFFSIIFNYYTSYMIILFLIIYFVWYSVSYSLQLKNVADKLLEFIISGLKVIALSSFFWIPLIYDLSKGKLNEETYVSFDIIRTPIDIIGQLLPFAYDGYSTINKPYLYCGVFATFSLIIFFISKRFSLKRKLATFFVVCIFLISFCYSKVDLIWHGFRTPNMYPARYSFLLSFFILLVFAEVSSIYFAKISSKKVVLCLGSLVFFMDISFNSIFLISSVDVDENIGPFLDRQTFDTFYFQTESVKNNLSVGNTYPDYKFTANDGFMFGINSIDYFLSSYNSGVSSFLHDIGTASMNHFIAEEGLTPVTSSLLGVNNILIRFEDSPNYSSTSNMIKEYYLEDYREGNTVIYSNPVIVSGGYFYDVVNAENEIFGWDAFANSNFFCSDITGIEDVFVPCEMNKEFEGISEDSDHYLYTISVSPPVDKHLLFYISSRNYIEDNKFENYDALYQNGNRIALFENNGLERIIDLGISDGSELEFVYESNSDKNEVYFYYFDDEKYYEALDSLKNKTISPFTYSKDGISVDVSSEIPQDLLLLLPYEKGYTIYVDDEKADFTSYRNAFISLHVDKGDHHIVIKYVTPGLYLGLVISSISAILYLGFLLTKYFVEKKKKNV